MIGQAEAGRSSLCCQPKGPPPTLLTSEGGATPSGCRTGLGQFSKEVWIFSSFELKDPVAESGFPGGSDGKASACNVGDLGLIPGLGRSPGEGNGNPLQHSCLENPMDRGPL